MVRRREKEVRAGRARGNDALAVAERIVGTLTGILRADAKGFVATFNQARQVVNELRGNLTLLGAGLGTVRDSGRETTKQTHSLVGEFRSLAAIVGVSFGLREIASATIENARASERLRTALSLQGPAALAAQGSLEAYAGELQRTTGFASNAIIETEALLAQFGVIPSVIPKATSVLLDFATVTGRDTRIAALLLNQAVETGTLSIGKGYGSVVLKATGETARFAEAIDILATKLPRISTAGGQGIVGLVNAFRNGISDILGEVGRLGSIVLFGDLQGRQVADFFDKIKRGIAGVGDTKAFAGLVVSAQGFLDVLGQIVGVFEGGFSPASLFAVSALKGLSDSMNLAAGSVLALLNALARIPTPGGNAAETVVGLTGYVVGLGIAFSILIRPIVAILGPILKLSFYLRLMQLANKAGLIGMTGLRTAFGFLASSISVLIGRLASVIPLIGRFLLAINPVTLVLFGVTTGINLLANATERYGRHLSQTAARMSAETNTLQQLMAAQFAANRSTIEAVTVQDLLATQATVTGEAIKNYAAHQFNAGKMTGEVGAKLFRLADALDAYRAAQLNANEVADPADAEALKKAYDDLLKTIKSLEDGLSSMEKAQAEANESALEASGAVEEAARARADREIKEAVRAYNANIALLDQELLDAQGQLQALIALGNEGVAKANEQAERVKAIDARVQAARHAGLFALGDVRVASELKVEEVAANVHAQRIKRDADLAARSMASANEAAVAHRDLAVEMAAATESTVDDAEAARDAAIARAEAEREVAFAASKTTVQMAAQARLSAERALANAGKSASADQLRALRSQVDRAAEDVDAALKEQEGLSYTFSARIATARMEGNRRVAEAEVDESKKHLAARIAFEEAVARRVAATRIAQGHLSSAELERIEQESEDRIATARVETLDEEKKALADEIDRRIAAGEEVGALVQRQAEIGRELDAAQTELLKHQSEAIRAAVDAQEAALGRLRDAFNVAFLDAEGRLRSFEDIWFDIWNNISDTTVKIINEQISTAIRGALDLATPGERKVAAGGATPGPGAALGREAKAGVPGEPGFLDNLLGPFFSALGGAAPAAGDKAQAAGEKVAAGLAKGTDAVEDAANQGSEVAGTGLGQLGNSLLGSIGGLVGGVSKGIGGLLGGVKSGLAGLLGPFDFLAGPLLEAGIGAVAGLVFGKKKKKSAAETSTEATFQGTGPAAAASTFFRAAESAREAPSLPTFTSGAAAGAGIIQTVTIPFNIQIVTPTSEAADAVRDQIRTLMPEITGIVARETERLRTQAEEGIPRRLALSSV